MSTQQVKISRFELLMDAGFGAQKAGDILIRAFAHTGRHIFVEPMIPAEISPPARSRPALSGVIIRVAGYDLKNIGNSTDLILAQHEVVLDRRLDDEEHTPKGQVLLDIGDKKANEDAYEAVCKRAAKEGVKVHPFETSAEANMVIKALGGKGKNMYYLGILSAIYNLESEIVEKEIRDVFGVKLKEEIFEKNIKIFKYGHKYAKENLDFSFDIKPGEKSDNEQILIDGNTSMALGLIDAGIKMFSGYPITPASSIMHTLAKEFPKYGGMVHQAEDEISAVGAAIGSYYGGVPSVTATSGPGLSLKQEFIGFAAASEVPLIVIDVQRSGPSTGMPTKTEQSDLPAVLWGSHGDNVQIVIGVGNVLDCFYAPKIARYFAEKLRLPVFIMSDFQMANSYKVIDKPPIEEMDSVDDIPDYIFKHYWMDKLPDNIEMVRDLQSNPGEEGKTRRITGLNTDQSGKINYFAKTNQRSHHVRNEKVHTVRRALHMPDLFGDVTEGDVLVIGWGTTRGAIAEAVHKCQEMGLKVGGFCFRIVYPFPLDLISVFSKFKHVVTVEAAYGDPYKKPPLAMLLRSKTLIDVQCILCRATGRPIAPKAIIEKIKLILAGEHV